MKYPSLTLLTIALILFTTYSSSTNIERSQKKTQFILERQIKSAKHSAEDYLEEISNLSNNAFELFYNQGEKGINFQTFEKIVQKTKSNKIPKEILQEKFKKFDSNGWGVMNYDDFTKFFKEFLITEAINTIKNRRFSNVTDYNTDIDKEIKYTKLNKVNNSTIPALRKEIPKKTELTVGKKSFLELGSLNMDDKKKLPEKSEKVKADSKKNMKKNEKKKLPEKEKNDKKKLPEKSEKVEADSKKNMKKNEKKSSPSKPVEKSKRASASENEKVLHKVIPSRDFSKDKKAKTIEELKRDAAAKWKTPQILNSIKKNKHYVL